MRELDRLGIRSVIDSGGRIQNYPDDYPIVQKLADDGELTLRIAYNLFTQRPKAENDDFVQWAKLVKPGDGNAWKRSVDRVHPVAPMKMPWLRPAASRP